MIARPSTWGDVWIYGYVSDQAGKIWKVAAEKSGWIQLVDAEGKQAAMVRPPDDHPVTLWEMTDQEAFQAIYRVFPGAEIIEIKELQNHG